MQGLTSLVGLCIFIYQEILLQKKRCKQEKMNHLLSQMLLYTGAPKKKIFGKEDVRWRQRRNWNWSGV